MIDDIKRFVKSPSELMKSDLWLDDGLYKLFHYCLYKANRIESLWQGISITPGQVPFSYRKAADELGWSRDKLIKKLSVLEQSGYVFIHSWSKGSVVTVVGWSDMQTAGGTESKPLRSENQTTSGTAIRPMWAENQATSIPESRPAKGSSAPNYGAFIDVRTGNQTSEPAPAPYKEYRKDKYLYSQQKDIQGFEQIWFAYPKDRRNRRDEAAALYQAAIENGATQEALLQALDAAKRSVNWCKENGQYIPGIVKWLQRDEWRDYLTQDEPEEDEEAWTSR